MPFLAVTPLFDWPTKMKLLHNMGDASEEKLTERKYAMSSDKKTMRIQKGRRAITLESILGDSGSDIPLGYWTMHLGNLSPESFADIVKMAPPPPLLCGFLDTKQVYVFVSNCPLDQYFVLPAHTDNGEGPLVFLGGSAGSSCEIQLYGLSDKSPVVYSVRLGRQGDGIHIPALHWHSVRSTGLRICISYFTNTPPKKLHV
jgi:hypothetical protein